MYIDFEVSVPIEYISTVGLCIGTSQEEESGGINCWTWNTNLDEESVLIFEQPTSYYMPQLEVSKQRDSPDIADRE